MGFSELGFRSWGLRVLGSQGVGVSESRGGALGVMVWGVSEPGPHGVGVSGSRGVRVSGLGCGWVPPRPLPFWLPPVP